MAQATMVSPQEAEKLVGDDKARLIDIRTVGEVIGGQIENSIYMPFDLISASKLEDAGLEDKSPILVCRSGVRAKQAAEALAQQVDNVAVLEGGIVEWEKQGLPVTKGQNVMPLERQVLVVAGSLIFLFTTLGLFASPVFFVLAMFMSGGMVFAGVTGACGMARVLMMLPWNKKPLCGQSCEVQGAAGKT